MTEVRWFNLDFTDRKIAGVRVGALLVVLVFVVADLAMFLRDSRDFSLVCCDVGSLEICLLICWVVAAPGQRLARGVLSYLAIFALILMTGGQAITKAPRAEWDHWRWLAFLGGSEGGVFSICLPGFIVGLSLVGLWIARQRATASCPNSSVSEGSIAERQFTLSGALFYITCLSILFACIARYLPYPAWPLECVAQLANLLGPRQRAASAALHMSATDSLITAVGYPALYAIVCWTGAFLVLDRWSRRNKLALAIFVTVIVSVVVELIGLLLVGTKYHELSWGKFLLNNLDNLGSLLAFAVAVRLLLPGRATPARLPNGDTEPGANEDAATTPIL